MSPELVIVIYWLTTGQPAVDLMAAPQCATLKAMTAEHGGVILELSDGTHLQAHRIECLPAPNLNDTLASKDDLTQ